MAPRSSRGFQFAYDYTKYSHIGDSSDSKILLVYLRLTSAVPYSQIKKRIAYSQACLVNCIESQHHFSLRKRATQEVYYDPDTCIS